MRSVRVKQSCETRRGGSQAVRELQRAYYAGEYWVKHFDVRLGEQLEG